MFFVDPGSFPGFSCILQHYEIGHTAIGAATWRMFTNLCTLATYPQWPEAAASTRRRYMRSTGCSLFLVCFIFNQSVTLFRLSFLPVLTLNL